MRQTTRCARLRSGLIACLCSGCFAGICGPQNIPTPPRMTDETKSNPPDRSSYPTEEAYRRALDSWLELYRNYRNNDTQRLSTQVSDTEHSFFMKIDVKINEIDQIFATKRSKTQKKTFKNL